MKKGKMLVLQNRRKQPKRNIGSNIGLKACPYCGGHAELQEVNADYGGGYVVRCRECHTITNKTEDKAKAVDDWNNNIFTEVTIRLNTFNINRNEDPEIIDLAGAINLSERILKEVSEEYRDILKRMIQHPYAKRELKGRKQLLEGFFMNSALMKALPIDGPEIIRILKKKVNYIE